MPKQKQRKSSNQTVFSRPPGSESLDWRIKWVLIALIIMATGVFLAAFRGYVFPWVISTRMSSSIQYAINAERLTQSGIAGALPSDTNSLTNQVAGSAQEHVEDTNPEASKIAAVLPVAACSPLLEMPSPPSLPVAPAPFEAWRKAFTDYAVGLGIDPQIVQERLGKVQPSQKVLAIDRHQSEFSQTFFGYLTSHVSESRLRRGRALIKQYRPVLADIERRRGVPSSLLVALWGMESDFGGQIGGFPVVASLATLAHDGRRPGFFTVELINALRIVQSGAIKTEQMKGSWAGAMGQPQFMPSTYCRHAVDGDGDGLVDIWNSVPDILESTAAYLVDSGWRKAEPWGREVLLPPGFAYHQARLSVKKTAREWQGLGVLDKVGKSLQGSDAEASIILPAGYLGPAFMVFANFDIIREWNRSLNYALTVGYLSDRLNGSTNLVGRPPPGDKALPRTSVVALQFGLLRLGFDAGDPDGFIGMRTREAVADYQECLGLPADGYPTAELVAQIEEKTASARPPLKCGPVGQPADAATGFGSARGLYSGSNVGSISTPSRTFERSRALLSQ